MRVVLSAVGAIFPPLLIFSIVASVAFCWGTNHLGMYRFPVVTWWQYLPYHGYRRDWDRWLFYGAILGAVPALAVFLRIVWEIWAKRFFFRFGAAQHRSGE